MSTRYNFFGGLVTDSLILNLDAAKLQSYPGTGTNWYDISGNNNNGTLTNGPTLTGSGKNLAIRFDGTNDYVDVIPPNFNRSETSICMFYRYDNPTVNYPLLMGNGTSTSNESFYVSALGPAYGASNLGKMSAFFKAGNTTNQVTGRIDLVSNIVTTGSSFYLVVTYKTNGTANMYINGTFHLSKPTTSDLLNPQVGSFVLGGGSPPAVGCDPFNGNISIFQMYNKALSPFEVYQNFNALKGRYDIPDIVTSGLTLNLDAGNPYSYNPLNTGSTTWVDTTYTTTGGTLINGTSYSGGTMVFDGTDDYVQVGTSAVVNESLPFTVSFWMKLTELVNGKTAPFIFKTNSGANFILIFGENSSQYKGTVLIVPGASAAVKTDTNTSFFLNNWVNITVTYNGLGATTPSNYVIYENTVLKNQNTGVGGVADPRVNTIFGYLNSGNVMKGNVSLMQIYNRALSQAEITQNFNALRGRYGI
jgi:hypothetical protein